jgi:glycosyltransferase involved in cell wall biosynthesis
MTFWKKGGRGTQLFYLIWQLGVYSLAQRLHLVNRFDIAHHLTFGKYWIPSRLAELDCPFVFGPVGGGEFTPPTLQMNLGWRGWLVELGKKLAIQLIENLPQAGRLYKKAAWTFAATPQTEAALRHNGVTQISILPQSGIDNEFLTAQSEISQSCKTGPLKLVSASRLIHWKAIDLAIEAVALALKDTHVELTIIQDGPEKNRLRTLAITLGIQGNVHFVGRLSRLDDVYHQISISDALIHPAVHEAFGQVCLESLALGVPVICLNWAGPGMIVDELSGIAVTPGNRQQTIEGLANAIRKIAAEKKYGVSRAAACKKRATAQFAWTNHATVILDQYKQILISPNN